MNFLKFVIAVSLFIFVNHAHAASPAITRFQELVRRAAASNNESLKQMDIVRQNMKRVLTELKQKSDQLKAAIAQVQAVQS